jgi:LSD1 subclass zinc finger protein
LAQSKASAERVVRDIRRATRRHFSAVDNIRIVSEGLRGDDSIAELCGNEGIAQSLYYKWSKEFMEAGKCRLAGDTARAATSVRCSICAAKLTLDKLGVCLRTFYRWYDHYLERGPEALEDRLSAPNRI